LKIGAMMKLCAVPRPEDPTYWKINKFFDLV